jgi:hypothetical protein
MSNSNDPSAWVELGLKVPDLIAGFAGGVVKAFILSKSDPWSIIGSMVVGALAANYLTEPFSRYLGTGAGTTGFIVGVGGMTICQGIVDAAKSWRPFSASKGANDARPNP